MMMQVISLTLYEHTWLANKLNANYDVYIQLPLLRQGTEVSAEPHLICLVDFVSLAVDSSWFQTYPWLLLGCSKDIFQPLNS